MLPNRDNEPSNEEEKKEAKVNLDTLQGDLLINRRLMGSHIQASNQIRRENIFILDILFKEKYVDSYLIEEVSLL